MGRFAGRYSDRWSSEVRELASQPPPSQPRRVWADVRRGADRPPRRRGLLLRISMAGVLVLLVALVFGTRVDSASARASRLLFAPERPEAGELIHVRYTATSLLAEEPALRVRARYFERNVPTTFGAPHAEVGILEASGGDSFEGTIQLSDSTVYAVLAVESMDGMRVDAYRGAARVLIHGSDDRPVLAGLMAQSHDLVDTDSRQALEVARSAASIHPEEPQAHVVHLSYEIRQVPRSVSDSILQAWRGDGLPRLLSQFPDSASVGPDQVWGLAQLLELTGDTAAAEAWRSVAKKVHPNSQSSLAFRVFQIGRETRDPVERLQRYEELYSEIGASSRQLPFSAYVLAQRLGDGEETRRWGRRLLQQDARFGMLVAPDLADLDEYRGEAEELLEKQVEQWDGPREDARPLTDSRGQFAIARHQYQARFLTLLGRLRAESGAREEALETLERAAEVGWDTERYRTIGDLRLELGDAEGALEAFALVAADPETASVYGDSVAAAVPPELLPAGEWGRRVEAARNVMAARTWRAAQNRTPVLSELELLDESGEKLNWSMSGGGPALVAFWSRYCAPSVRQLDALDNLAGLLNEEEIRFLAVTDAEDAGAVNDYLAERGLSFRSALDVSRHATLALDNTAWPRYVVLDQDGRIRFSGHSLDPVRRQLWLLKEEAAGRRRQPVS